MPGENADIKVDEESTLINNLKRLEEKKSKLVNEPKRIEEEFNKVKHIELSKGQ